MSSTVVIRVDATRCQGHGRCFDTCPEVFVPDVEGYATVTETTVEAGTPVAERVHRAVVGCPERAISVS
jgi:ferredoxin